jgi:hypothetical protein
LVPAWSMMSRLRAISSVRNFDACSGERATTAPLAECFAANSHYLMSGSFSN